MAAASSYWVDWLANVERDLSSGKVEVVEAVIALEALGYGGYSQWVVRRSGSDAKLAILEGADVLPGRHRVYVAPNSQQVVGMDGPGAPADLALYRADLLRIQGLSEDDASALSSDRLSPGLARTVRQRAQVAFLLGVAIAFWAGLTLWAAFSSVRPRGAGDSWNSPDNLTGAHVMGALWACVFFGLSYVFGFRRAARLRGEARRGTVAHVDGSPRKRMRLGRSPAYFIGVGELEFRLPGKGLLSFAPAFNIYYGMLARPHRIYFLAGVRQFVAIVPLA